MPKLVISKEGRALTEWSLSEKETVLGRDADCDVHLDDPAVSRHHAKVARIYTGYFIEDLHSTNGLTLNGRKVRKHMLKDGDLVQIGTHEIRYAAESAGVDLDKTVVLTPRGVKRERIAAPPPSERAGRAYIRFLSGPDQGDSKLVDKSLYTLGKAGGNLAVISRRAHGYFLLHLGGDVITTLNGAEVHGAGVKLNDGDRIQVGELELEFYSEP
jgi:pSer/pThr/pTyr-binding forkhead associated (FHA) protein